MAAKAIESNLTLQEVISMKKFLAAQFVGQWREYKCDFRGQLKKF